MTRIGRFDRPVSNETINTAGDEVFIRDVSDHPAFRQANLIGTVVSHSGDHTWQRSLHGSSHITGRPARGHGISQ